MAAQVASLFGVLSLRDDEFRRGMADAQGEMQTLSGRLETMGGQMQNFGQRMTLMTAPIAAGLGVAVNDSRNFSREMSNVNAILGISGDEAAELRAQILEFGGDTVAGPHAAAEAFYSIVSGVQDASTHMAILEASTRTAEAGQANLAATTDAMIATMNSYKLQADDAAFVSDVFSRTVGMGVLTMEDLSRALPQATGLAAQFNVPLEEVAGSMAYMTTQGFEASQSATFLRSMMSTLLNPTADLAAAIEGLGYQSGQSMIESLGLVDAYQLLASQAGGLTGLITNQEALTGGLLLTQDAANAFLGDYVAGIDGATAAAQEIQDQSAGWDRLRSKLQELSITVGDGLEPILSNLLENTIVPGIDTVLDWANENENAAQSLILVMGGAVVLGPAMMVLGAIISGVGKIVGVFSIAIRGAIAVLGFMLSPMGLVVGAGAAIGAAFYLMRDDIRRALDGALNTIRNFKNQAVGWLNEVAVAIGLAQPPQNWTGGGWTGGGSSGGGSVGFRAEGGPVTRGMPYVVGERGPELFVPASSGYIVPNVQTGAGGVNLAGAIFNIHANSYEAGRAAGRGFREELDMLINEAG